MQLDTIYDTISTSANLVQASVEDAEMRLILHENENVTVYALIVIKCFA